MSKYIYVEVDSNDGDYVGRLSKISDEDLELIMPLIEAIKNFKSYTGKSEDCDFKWNHHHNYPDGECLREDLGELPPEKIYPNIPKEVFGTFEYYLPYCEYGFHTIKTIKIVSLEKELL